MAGHWPLIVHMLITMDKGKDWNEVHHWLTSRRIKHNIRHQKSFKSYSKQNKPSDPVPKAKHLVQLCKIYLEHNTLIVPFNYSFDQFNQLQGLEHVPLLDCFWFVISWLTNCYITSLLLSASSLIIMNKLGLLLIMQNDAHQ
jgi:hypothetical protein